GEEFHRKLLLDRGHALEHDREHVEDDEPDHELIERSGGGCRAAGLEHHVEAVAQLAERRISAQLLQRARSRMPVVIASSAACACAPSGPPPCAMSGRPPPPLPPTASTPLRSKST